MSETKAESSAAEDRLDLEVMDAVAGLFARLLAEGDKLAEAHGVPFFFIKALHLIDKPLPMKELGQRMHCDPSFVTSIADMLERRGLAVRESDPGDRRVKRLVLTEAGVDFKQLLEQKMLDFTPWRQALSTDERQHLLTLIRAMAPPMSVTKSRCSGGEVKTLLGNAAPRSVKRTGRAGRNVAADERAAG
ncbi:MAG TPA: MarR family transcriptional regulator [Streptosporangiaceae bacterium]|jgi:DNA-binding MarR family transcriptional regulator|nr:MarR family transcriptional regulator [Streptosporangiaceae bacterium]